MLEVDIDESFDPIDAPGYAIEELGHTQAELAEMFVRIRSNPSF